MLPMRVARRFVVSGRVQGVGFRYFTHDAALREGVTGWVRNLPGGQVEALVEGDAEAVTRVERALRSGPRGAHVETVDVDVEEPTGAYMTFTVTA
ncbi:MAG TPA: acylphosphatase [Vicinamibacterales bacterium]|nr:acylphosphatase [Vicinamibacterales bacterium]